MSSIIINHSVTIYNTFASLIKNGKYEEIILDIMNNSKEVFPNTYKHIEEQSNGESDFVDLFTGQKYDAKLVLTNKQGELIGRKEPDHVKWIESFISELCEYGDLLSGSSNNKIEDYTLYKIMSKKLISIKEDEDVIFLIPFPVTIESPKCIYLKFATDVLQAILATQMQN